MPSLTTVALSEAILQASNALFPLAMSVASVVHKFPFNLKSLLVGLTLLNVILYSAFSVLT